MRNNAITKGFKKVLKTHVLAFDLKIKVLKKNIANFLRKDNSRQLEYWGLKTLTRAFVLIVLKKTRSHKSTKRQLPSDNPMGWFNHSLAEIPIVFSGWTLHSVKDIRAFEMSDLAVLLK
ncbi:hypothetical protein HPSA20_1612 [Helicobacter pylori SouthAfrica20]|uniref:Uncharacterized protein n=1 Tax=Helicobacter pylori SouthAfrica20 TaxID=1352356 RepID=T1UBW2_HELPX|nr:hypothetical protein HPSA20_1612 [Helicobacter pylori SouthAfrica20]